MKQLHAKQSDRVFIGLGRVIEPAGSMEMKVLKKRPSQHHILWQLFKY